MHILLVTRSVVSGDGQGRVNLQLARHSLALGHRVTLVTERVDESILAHGARWIAVRPLFNRPSLVREWQFARDADRIVRRARDGALVVGNGYSLTVPHDINISHFVHHAWAAHLKAAPNRWRGLRARHHALYTQLNIGREKTSYAAARSVVAISNRVRDELITAGVPHERIQVIYNGVDTDEFRPGETDRNVLGLTERVPLGLFVGDIRTDRKNLGTAIRALAKAPSVHFAIVGDAGHSPYPEMARRLGVAKRVAFLGYRTDVPQIMRACDFLVFPTRYEPFGLVLLEALSSGLPVITTRQAGAAEVLSPECGILLDDPDDVAALARAMSALTNAPVKSSFSAAGREIACQHSWSKMAARYISLFEDLTVKVRPPHLAT